VENRGSLPGQEISEELSWGLTGCRRRVAVAAGSDIKWLEILQPDDRQLWRPTINGSMVRGPGPGRFDFRSSRQSVIRRSGNRPVPTGVVEPGCRFINRGQNKIIKLNSIINKVMLSCFLVMVERAMGHFTRFRK
jgi:hypothetical protein